MLIPESILKPFGYTGIPFLRFKCDPEAIEGTLTRLVGHLRGFSSEDIKDSLECAVILLGANNASCYIHRSNYPDEIGDNFTLHYILPSDEQPRAVHLTTGSFD